MIVRSKGILRRWTLFSIRLPAVAGRFYPSDAAALDREVRGYLVADPPPAPAVAVIGPHAGYAYSGSTAGATYSRVVVPRTAVVLCPNHTGMGATRALGSSGAWRLPGGDIEVDAALAERLRGAAHLEDDPLAHRLEHSAEVHLPFLRARNPNVRIVPICLGYLGARACVRLGEEIAQVIRSERDDVLLVASTDMSHNVSADEARRLDAPALARIEALDAEGLCEVVETTRVSMCGCVPTAVVVAAARALGARRATLVRYTHSGEVSGETDRVVAYAGFVVPRAS